MESKDMLKHQVCNSDRLSSHVVADSPLVDLGFTREQESSPRIPENCSKTLDCPVQPAKKSQLPSNFSLFLAWMFLLMTVGALLAPISTSWSYESFSNQSGREESGLALPE